jgi:hypothetical protein
MPQPLVLVAVLIADLRPDWVAIPFVVDTGAAVTCIHALDAMADFNMSVASLDPSSWPASVTGGGIGGQLRHLIFKAQFGFEHEDGTLDIIEGPVRIGESASGSLPSLLGCDVLRHFEVVYRGGRSITLDRLPD